MKLSEAIAELLEIMKQHGDLVVLTEDSEYGLSEEALVFEVGVYTPSESHGFIEAEGNPTHVLITT